MNKPTFIEYMSSHRSTYVRSLDGQSYYLVQNEPKGCRFSFVILALVLYLFVQAACKLLWKQPIWWNIKYDFIFTAMVLVTMKNYRRYRRISFHDIRDDEERLNEARTLAFSRYESRLLAAAYILGAALLLVHSLSLLSLRSVLEHREAMSDTLIIVDNWDVSESGGQERELVHEVGNGVDTDYAYFLVDIEKTPIRASFRLNGQPLAEGVKRIMFAGWLFDSEYLEQNYAVYIPIENIHDGSVLDMDCGSLHRTWTFHSRKDAV